MESCCMTEKWMTEELTEWKLTRPLMDGEVAASAKTFIRV